MAREPLTPADILASMNRLFKDIEDIPPHPLNGADFLYYAPDMGAQAKRLEVACQEYHPWKKDIRLYERNTIPPGMIVGMRYAIGDDGPYPDVVLIIGPQKDPA